MRGKIQRVAGIPGRPYLRYQDFVALGWDTRGIPVESPTRSYWSDYYLITVDSGGDRHCDDEATTNGNYYSCTWKLRQAAADADDSAVLYHVDLKCLAREWFCALDRNEGMYGVYVQIKKSDLTNGTYIPGKIVARYFHKEASLEINGVGFTFEKEKQSADISVGLRSGFSVSPNIYLDWRFGYYEAPWEPGPPRPRRPIPEDFAQPATQAVSPEGV